MEAEQFEVFFQPELASRGYQCRFHPKSRARTMDEIMKKTVDGCVTFWKRDLFTFVNEEVIEFHYMAMIRHDNIGQAGINRLMTKDNIALSVLLKPKHPLIVSPHTNENDHLYVVNTHIHWDPNCSDVKLMQVQMLLDCLEEKVQQHKRIYGWPLPLIICGDFNSHIDSAVYQLLSGKYVEGNHEDFCGQDYGTYTKKGLAHSLSLKSAYTSVMGSEPPFTNFTGDFIGVLDYIWYTDESLSSEKVLAPLNEETIRSYNGALPNPFMCSDHIPIACELYGKLQR